MSKSSFKKITLNPIIFVEREFWKSIFKLKVSKFFFVVLNIVSFIATFFVSSLTILTFSKMFWNISTWFYFTTAGVTASTTFITTMINFFYVKDKIKTYEDLSHFLHTEIILYQINEGNYKKTKNKDFEIFRVVCKRLGYAFAKEVKWASLKK